MTYRFGVFEFDSDSGELRRNGRAVALEPQPARALEKLLSNAGSLVSRDELKAAIWGNDIHVDFDRGLAYCLSQIRGALGDSGENPRFVQTLPRKGYRFIAPIQPVVVPVSSPAPAKRRQWPIRTAAAAVLVLLIAAVWVAGRPSRILIAVSIFDNETGVAEHDRLVSGLADLVVTRLANLSPGRLGVIGNASILRQPRNIRNLKAVQNAVHPDYVVLGQLQEGEGGLRFITHFIRMADGTHLRANRISLPDGKLASLESAVPDEFERAVRQHVLR